MHKKIIILILSLVLGFQSAWAGVVDDIQTAVDRVKYSGRHEFEIDVRGGKVTFSGFVSSSKDKASVEKAALNVRGVREVVNNLKVLSGSIVSNSEVAKLIRDRIKADGTIRNYELNIEQDGNLITLSGDVDSSADKDHILSIAREAARGNTIQNDLIVKVKPVIPDGEINERVWNALRAEAVPGLDGVALDTREGVVIFTGQVKNHREIDKILSVTLMVEGVKNVKSEVQILQ